MPFSAAGRPGAASCAANNAPWPGRAGPRALPAALSTGHAGWCGDRDGLLCRGGCHGTHGGTVALAAGGPGPWDAAGCRMSSPRPSVCRGGGDGDGVLGSGLPAWPQDAALATAGHGVPARRVSQRGRCCPARQIASFPCQFWERGTQHGNSGLSHMALAGLSPVGGGAAALRRAGVARQPSTSKPPAAPHPAGTTQGTATPGRRGAAGGYLCRGDDGGQPAPQPRQHPASCSARRAPQGCEQEEGKQRGHHGSGCPPPPRPVNGTPKPGLLLPWLGLGSIQVPSPHDRSWGHARLCPGAAQSLQLPVPAGRC